jgi:large subunit ribosomal protein L17
MRHRVAGRKFGRKRGDRRAFLRTLEGNLVMHERIVTTEARAKEIRGKVEKLITLAKRRGGDLASYRLLLRRLPTPAAAKVYRELRERYQNRHGGYVRIMKTGMRRIRDGAATVIVELVK